MRKALKLGVLVVSLAVVLCLAWYIAGRLTRSHRAIRIRTSQQAPHTPSSTEELRIGTYNIAHGRGLGEPVGEDEGRSERMQRLKHIARLLRQERLDVVVLNEVSFYAPWSGHVNQAAMLAREAGFPYWLEHRCFEIAMPFYCVAWGNAVLSRFPITDAWEVDHPTYSSWENALAGNKRAALCIVQLAEGRRFRLLAVHFEHRSQPVCIGSARAVEVVRRDGGPPLVCAGDFNSTPVGYPHCVTDQHGRSAMSVLLEGGGFRSLPQGDPLPQDFTFHAADPRSVIDWVLVPPRWRIVSKEVPAVDYSDHRPVILTVVPLGL